jgi:hypothetical protein
VRTTCVLQTQVCYYPVCVEDSSGGQELESKFAVEMKPPAKDDMKGSMLCWTRLILIGVYDGVVVVHGDL